MAHVFFFALKGSDEYEQEVPEALYGDSSSIRGAEEHPERNKTYGEEPLKGT